MSTRTRRDFLKIATVAAAASRVTISSPALAAAAAPVGAGGIDVRVTTGEKRYGAAERLRWSPASGGAEASRITIDGGKTLQPVLGFGAAFTDAACYMFSQMPEPEREALLEDLFDPKEMGLSVCRTCVGSSDYARSLYSYDEGEPDPELKRFSIDHDKAYILPTIRRARKINPDLFLLASPWSPPGWMKDNNTMLGGTIRGRYLDAYASYFVKFLQAYRAEGVEVNAISSQNEVDTDQDSRMPACLFPQEVEVKFVGQSLGPALEKAGLKTKIWLIDHNYNLWGRAIAMLDDPTVNKYSKAIAWHGYVGQPEWMQKVAAAHPEAEMYWTEGGPDITDPAYRVDWTKWSRTFTGVLRNGTRCIIGWNLVLDENGKPNIGPFPCGGLVTVHSQTHEVTRSGQYWAFAHYSRAIRRQAVVIPSSGTIADVDHVAARNPDGSYVLVLTHSGAEPRTVRVQVADQAAEVALPADSLTTLTWS
jgi:glucosylceramidase